MPTNFFGTVSQIIFVEKGWHPYYAKIISTPAFFWNFKALSTRFSALWDRKFLTLKRHTYYYAWNFSITLTFLKQWRDVHVFWHSQTWNFRQKNVMPPTMQKYFRYHNFSDTLQGCSRRYSVLRDQIFRQKYVMRPLFIRKQFSESKTFSKTVGLLHKNFRHWDRQFPAEKCDTLIMHIFFRYPNFSETLKECPRIFSALWDREFLTEKRDNPYYA